MCSVKIKNKQLVHGPKRYCITCYEWLHIIPQKAHSRMKPCQTMIENPYLAEEITSLTSHYDNFMSFSYPDLSFSEDSALFLSRSSGELVVHQEFDNTDTCNIVPSDNIISEEVVVPVLFYLGNYDCKLSIDCSKRSFRNLRNNRVTDKRSRFNCI